MSEYDSFVIRTDADRFGDVIDLTLIVDLPAGVHIEPHQPAEEHLIPTVLTVRGLHDVAVDYPHPVDKDLGWKGARLTVLEGTLRFSVSGRLTADTDRVGGTLTYQPCIGGACLPPRTVTWSAPLPGVTTYSVLSALAS